MANFAKSSFLDGFDVPEITHETIKKQIVKSHTSQSYKKSSSIEKMPLSERLKYIEQEVYKILGRYKGFVRVIRSKEDLNAYIDNAIKNVYLSFDTETNNSLDPLTCKLMGLCMYVPNTRPVYVPINHCVPGTDILLENQVTMEDVKEVFQKLKDSDVKMIYHNGKFDIRVCYNTSGVYLPIWWDTMIAAQLIDENELARLKQQYKLHIDPTVGSYNIEKLFTGLPYAWVSPDVFALYAAIDAYDTYGLQQYQYEIFSSPGLERLYNLFQTVEVPVVIATAKMEDAGVCLDTEFLEKLDSKCKKELERYSNELQEILVPYEQSIRYYQNTGKLDSPVNFDSPPQLNIVLYDILKTPVIEEFGRSTDKATLKALKTPFTKALLEYRHFGKLISSFTEPLPKLISVKDGKIHANFNQMGAEDNNVRTGRFHR